MRTAENLNRASAMLVVSMLSTMLSCGPALADEVIADDLIVQGKTCVGPPCVDGESFGTGTLRLKDGETRLDFINTNASPFAARDWRIEANSTASGGAAYLAIKDMGDSSTGAEGGTALFTASAGAPANSLFIDSTGRIGVRTGTPLLDLHVNTGNTPAIRLEQNSGGGNGAQTWDVGGNESNFFVRDLTNGSVLPFRILPGAPTESLDVTASGIGIGTATPQSLLHLFDAGSSNVLATFENGSALWSVGTDTGGRFTVNSSSGQSRIAIAASGNVGVGTTAPSVPLEVAGDALVGRGSSTSNQTRTLSIGGARPVASSDYARLSFVNYDSNSGATDYVGAKISSQNNGASDDGDLRFFTVNSPTAIDPVSPQMIITPAGRVGIGTATPQSQLHTTDTVRFGGVAGCSEGIVSSSVGVLSCLGTSSRRIKNITGILPPQIALANVMALKPQVGSYKETPETTEHWFIAEDVAEVNPALVGYKDGEPYTVKTRNVVADLVAVIQLQQRQIEEARERIEALEQGLVGNLR